MTPEVLLHLRDLITITIWELAMVNFLKKNAIILPGIIIALILFFIGSHLTTIQHKSIEEKIEQGNESKYPFTTKLKMTIRPKD